ncbi:excisionase [Pantoea sp. GD03673]|uniref:excisionase n=1 Tax=Pantoea sp. GD03673 TaxID=2975364 RepID=UPI00244BDFB5|nr:excisionase [Pantoea sp. GD03673]MDH2066860.1 excisionase [Pantoea sp. GD03673]
MSRLISLSAWAEEEFDDPIPSTPTLLKYAKNGMISPQPLKAGRCWRVERTAKFIGLSAAPVIKNNDDKRLKRILEDGSSS